MKIVADPVLMRLLAMILCLLMPVPALAQDGPAYAAFGKYARPSAGVPNSFGTYTRGCLSGGAMLPETAPLWQAMKPARNRFWGHPEMIEFIQRLAVKARDAGWPGLYIGDIGQPRGGPMKSGHRSHQMGLDVDIWLRKPTRWRPMNRKERNGMWSHIVVAKNGVDLNGHWTESHHQVLRAAASDPAVARIFVNSAIKRWMCNRERGADGRVDAGWLRKIRPWKGHNAHFHVRLKCPIGARNCRNQGAPPPGSGCGAEISNWYPGGSKAEKPRDQTKKAPSEEASGEIKFKWAGRDGKTRALTRAISLSAMPSQCRAVLADNAAALAKIDAYADEVVREITLPVFFEDKVAAHEGYVGTRYFWRPKVDLAAARARDVSLRVAGQMPPGLEFVDRGGGNGLVRGTPTTPGDYTFTVVARTRGSENGRQTVRMSVITLDADERPVFADSGTPDSGTPDKDTPVTPAKTGDRPVETGGPAPETPKTAKDPDLPELPRTGDLGVTIGAGEPKGPDKDAAVATRPEKDGAASTKPTGPEPLEPKPAGDASEPYDPFRKDPLTLSLEHQVKDFLTEFTGDECFLAVPYRIASADIRIETFADDKEPILAFDRSFLKAIGIEARIGGRLIAQPQCPALAFVRAHPYGSPAPIETEPGKRVVAPGQPITIAVAAARVRTLSMMVIWPDGQIFDLTDHLERRGNRLAVTVKAAGRGPQVIVALDTASPIPPAARAEAVRQRDLFAATRDGERDLDVRASVALIVVE